MFGRNRLAQLVAEFLGAGVLTLVVLSVQRSTIGIPYFVSLAAGLTIAVLMVAFGRASGAQFNPAITLGMWTVRRTRTLQAVSYIIAQMLGAWLAYATYKYFVNAPLQEVGGHYAARVMIAEAVGAFIFSIGWAAAVFHDFLSSKAAATVGAAFMLGAVVAASASIGLINPALAFGIRAWDPIGAMGWLTYALGPVLGAVVGFNLYALVFAPTNSLVAAGATAGATVAPAPAARARSTAAKAPAKRKPAARKTTTRRASSSRSRR